MVTLNTSDFTNLLHDIYTIYAPDKMDGIDVLIAKYDGEYTSQRNAIQMAYIIYNKPKHPSFNPESGTEMYITKLMEKYARGERIISQETINEEKSLAAQAAERQSEESQREAEERAMREIEARNASEDEKKKALKEILEQTNEQSKKLKELDELKKQIEQQKEFIKSESQNLQKNITSTGSLFSEITLECDIPINFPGGNDYLTTLCIGQRLIYQNPDSGAIIGLEVEDINDDLFSSEDKKPIRIMKIKRI